MRNLLKKIILISAIILGTSILLLKITDAAPSDIGRTTTLSLLNQPWTYCVQHNKNFKESTSYTYQYYLRIEGDYGICYYNGGTQNAKNYKVNAVLSYILSGGDNSYYGTGYGSDYNNLYTKSPRQIALWNYWNIWLENASEVNDGYGLVKSAGGSVQNGDIPSMTSTTNGEKAAELIAEAQQYADGASSASIRSNITNAVNTSNGMAGPFNISYTGFMEKIKVLDTEGNAIGLSEGLKFIQNGVEIQGGWTNTDGSGTIGGINLQPNVDFYIENKSGRVIKSVTIDVEKTNTIYIADINILTATNQSQTLLNVGQGQKYDQTRASTTIEVKSETLRIVKSTEDGNRQENVGFIIYKANEDGGATPYGYLYYKGQEKATGRLVYDASQNTGFWQGEGDSGREGATIFYTSNQNVNGSTWPGFFEISGLPPGKYSIGEVYNENSGYESSVLKSYTVQINEGSENGPYYDITRATQNLSRYRDKMPLTQTISVIINNGTTMRLGLVDGLQPTEDIVLKISKFNEDLSGKEEKAEVAKDVEFYIQCNSGVNNGKYILQSGSGISFVSSKSSATKFKTGSNGAFQVVLPKGNTYKIIETNNPSARHNEDIISAEFVTKASENAEITVNKNTSTNLKDNITISGMEPGFYEVKLINDRTGGGGGGNPTTQYIKGVVWIEKSNSTGKNNYSNQVYTSGEDYVLKGATVQLVNKNNNIVYRSATTDSNGKYSLSYSSIDISKYYVRITISDSCDVYKGGSIVRDEDGNELTFKSNAYVKVASQYDVDNGCKFMDYQNKKATTFTGSISDDANSEASTDEINIAEDKFGLSGIYANGQIDNVNLGLKEISTSEKIEQVVKKAVIKVNGYQYTYNYNTSGNNVTYGTQQITVNWQNKTAYTRDIYPSDVQALSQNAGTMEAKITYTIIITNLTKSSDYSPETDNSDGFYDSITCHEDYLVINSGSLRNTFDNTRYELDDGSWSSVSNKEAKYNGSINIEEDGVKKVDITFKVKNDAIKKILSQEYSIEDYPTTASMTAYHKWHEYLTWTVEKETEEGTEYITKHKTKNHTTESNYAEGSAPYFAFKLADVAREITGTVFEDTDANTSDHELLGNGIYTGAKNKVENVKVELLKESDNSKATLYNRNGTTAQAETYTDSSGKFKFSGVIPGEYYVRYTYGDGDQVISDGTNVYASQFKSTIVTTYNPAYDTSDSEWYLYNRGEGYSLALDNIDDRKFEDSKNSVYGYGSYYAGLKNNKNEDVITADTDMFDIKVEFSTYNSDNWNIDYPSFNDMNFGIIKMPVISLNIYKTIRHVTITLSNGQVITTGNPKDSINYISVLDEDDVFGFGRSGYVKGELDTQYLYGSTLQITYDIEVLNTSDVNYKTEDYYKYGKKGNAEQEYTVFVDRVLDYLDPSLTYLYCEEMDLSIDEYDPSKSGLSQQTISYVSGIDASVDNAENESERNFSGAESKVLDINIKSDDERRELYTYHSPEDENRGKSSITVISVTASKLLSTEDDDLEFKNLAELVKVTTDKEGNGNICRFMAPTASFEDTSSRDIEYRSDYRSDTTDVATITLTPPTGLSGNAIIFISIGIGLIIIATGVIIIKKKIL